MKKVSSIIVVLFILTSIPVSLYLLNQKTNFWGKAFGVNANIYINAGNVFEGKNESWKYLAQGGEEKGRQLQSVVTKTKLLKPKYIRIDHVYDFYNIVSRDQSGNLVYNWSEFDLVLSDIKAMGAKPFISLSYMPEKLSSTGQIIDNPANWSDWQSLVKATVEHVSGKNGLNISDVYYEVWNEPDLFGKYKTYGSKNYLDLYYYSAVGAANARNVQSFKIGGPATTGYYENWMKRMISFSQEKNIRLDFLSWHRYSKDMDIFESDVNQAQKYGKEIIISEAGPNSENDEVYDSGFGAIHALALISSLEGKIDKLFNFEVKDGPGPSKNWSRWGILTHEKFGEPTPKPRYYALSFLNNLEEGVNMESSGSGSWVKFIAKAAPGKIVVLIVNYDKYGSHFENVPLRLVNLPFSKFNLKSTNYGEKSKNQEVSIEGNVWETNFAMEPNTAILLELTAI